MHTRGVSYYVGFVLPGNTSRTHRTHPGAGMLRPRELRDKVTKITNDLATCSAPEGTE
jgi:hypothetical protein